MNVSVIQVLEALRGVLPLEDVKQVEVADNQVVVKIKNIAIFDGEVYHIRGNTGKALPKVTRVSNQVVHIKWIAW